MNNRHPDHIQPGHAEFTEKLNATLKRGRETLAAIERRTLPNTVIARADALYITLFDKGEMGEDHEVWGRKVITEALVEASPSQRFHLQRDIDETGVSGTGRVAEGCLFSNGKVAITWLTKYTSLTMYDSMDVVQSIHGHGGKTRIVFDD